MEQKEKKDHSARTFMLQCLAVAILSFVVHFFEINVPLWAYIQSALLLIYGFTPEWVAMTMDYFLEVFSGIVLLIIFYVKLMISHFRKDKSSKNKKDGSVS